MIPEIRNMGGGTGLWDVGFGFRPVKFQLLVVNLGEIF